MWQLTLTVPVLIFGAGACNAAQAGLPFLAPLLWLGAALVLALVLAPLACAAALRISLSLSRRPWGFSSRRQHGFIRSYYGYAIP